MSFFYDLNKKLDGIRATPEVTHQQLNERDMGKHNNATTGFKALAKKAGGGEKGERIAGAQFQKMKKAGQLEEMWGDPYHDNAKVDAINAANPPNAPSGKPNRFTPTPVKHHTYDRKSVASNISGKDSAAYDYRGQVEEGPMDTVKKVGKRVAGGINRLVGHGSDEDMRKDLQRKAGAPVTGKKPEQRSMRETAGPVDYEKVLEAIAALYGDDMWDNDAMGDLAQDLEQAGPTDRELDFIIAKGKLPTRLKNIRFTNTDDVQFGHLDEKSGAPMSSKQKSFAALAPPANKITFADKIAGAKKEVDEMLGDVAAEAMRGALSGGQKKLDKNHNGKLDANDFAMLRKGGKNAEMAEDQPTHFEVHYKDNQKGRTAKTKVKGSDAKQAKAAWNDWNRSNTPGRFTFVAVKPVATEMDEERSKGTAFDMSTPRVDAPKAGSTERGHKHDITHSTSDPRYKGRTVIRRTDAQGISVGSENDDEGNKKEKRTKAGRPDGTGKKIGAKGPSGNSKLITKVDEVDIRDQGDNESSELKAAMMLLKKSGYKVTKAESTDTRDDHAERAGKKVAKDIEYDEKKKDGITGKKRGPEDDKAEKAGKKVTKDIEHDEKKEKEVDESTTSGSVATSTAKKSSGGSMVGKGIYDSMNFELEQMIAESMSINMSDSTEGGKSLTITATDEDALKLGMMLKNAGLGGGDAHGGDMHSPGEEPCETCGMEDCGCGDVQEAVDENSPDWPTNTETSSDALQYPGGLNKPKTDVAGDGQTTIPNTAVHTQEEDALRRMMEMAGIKQAELEPWKETMKEEGVAEEWAPMKTSAVGKKDSLIAGDFDKWLTNASDRDIMDYVHDEEGGGMPTHHTTTRWQELKKRQTDLLGGPAAAREKGINDRLKSTLIKKYPNITAPMKEEEEVEEDFLESIQRMREIAGIREAKRPDYPDVDNDGDKKEPLEKALKDKEEKKVDESIFALTNQWTAYKG